MDSIGLIKVLRGMNEGHDAVGSSVGTNASFYIGTALNLNMTDEETKHEIDKNIAVTEQSNVCRGRQPLA